MSSESESTSAGRRRVELILEQIESLPTLSAVAVRVLNLSTRDDAEIREIVTLIESDPALSARVLSLCRRADRATSSMVTTVDRAVMMIGLDALRAAMLSIEVFGLLGEMERDPLHDSKNIDQSLPDEPEDGPRLDRAQFWRHCIAVACASELIARNHAGRLGDLQPGEAFLAGLLHDLGKLALSQALPRTYRRVLAIADRRQVNIAEVERSIIGLDHHVAGKRLAEHWGLPHALQDVMWLHSQSAGAVPDLAHRPMIGVVTIADVVARALHIGWSGNYAPTNDVPCLCEEWGLDYALVREIEMELHESVASRTAMLGLDAHPSEKLLLESIAQANRRLGHMAALAGRASGGTLATQTLTEIEEFLSSCGDAGTVGGALTEIARSFHRVFGSGLEGFLWKSRAGDAWRLFRCGAAGRVTAEEQLDGPRGVSGEEARVESRGVYATDSEFTSWAERQVSSDGPSDRVRLCVLRASSPAIVLVHRNEMLHEFGGKPGVEALARTWGAAASGAARHAGARRLGEQLADASRRLGEAQCELVNQRSMARLGRMTAGAAHEMNNPLMVISGVAQQLASHGEDEFVARCAGKILESSEKLSGLIEALHFLADPPTPKPARANVMDLLRESAQGARARVLKESGGGAPEVRVSCAAEAGQAVLDVEQIGAALTELIVNAMQSGPRSFVEVRAQIEPSDGRLLVSVKDDGEGMESQTLEHACDPFFSSLRAGRRTGLGLARARRYVDLNGGELTLESVRGEGTIARIFLPRVSVPAVASGAAA